MQGTKVTIESDDKSFLGSIRESRISEWFGGNWRLADDKWTLFNGNDFHGTRTFIRLSPVQDLVVGDLYRWTRLDGIKIMVRVVAIEFGEVCINDGYALRVVKREALS